MTDVIELAKVFGLPAGLVVFFVWIGWIREQRLSKRISELEAFCQTELMQLIAANSKIIAENTAQAAQTTATLTRLNQQLSERPCWLSREQMHTINANLRQH